MKKKLQLGGAILILFVFVVMGYVITNKSQIVDTIKMTLRERKNYPPYKDDIKLDSTNLPVIYIETDRIYRDDYTEAKVKIIDDKGKIDYEGNMAIRYRGHASFNSSDKKSYSLRPLDEFGKKDNVSLLGMRKNKKWALKGNWIDKSMIRESIAYELAKHTGVATPELRFCEVVINGMYYGLYVLSEQPTRKNLGINKVEYDITGGYLLYFARQKEADFIVESPLDSEKFQYPFFIKYPDEEDVTDEMKEYLRQRISDMCKAVYDTAHTDYEKYIDVMSFIDFQISTEFATNTDAYSTSGYLYKDNDNTDGRFRMCLWDGDHAFGMGREPNYASYDHWVYQFYEDIDLRHRYNWWYMLMHNRHYRNAVSERWRECRRNIYSDANVYHVVDSLYNLLTSGGAMERNNQAWGMWNDKGCQNVHPHVKYLSDSFDDEVNYIKTWISHRLLWMDKHVEQ